MELTRIHLIIWATVTIIGWIIAPIWYGIRAARGADSEELGFLGASGVMVPLFWPIAVPIILIGYVLSALCRFLSGIGRRMGAKET